MTACKHKPMHEHELTMTSMKSRGQTHLYWKMMRQLSSPSTRRRRSAAPAQGRPTRSKHSSSPSTSSPSQMPRPPTTRYHTHMRPWCCRASGICAAFPPYQTTCRRTALRPLKRPRPRRRRSLCAPPTGGGSYWRACAVAASTT